MITLNIDVKQVLNIFDSYGSSDAAKGNLGLHRLIEALKHMFAARMNLGDPNFVDVNKSVSEMLSSSYAKQIQQKIFDNTTFSPGYYMYRYDNCKNFWWCCHEFMSVNCLSPQCAGGVSLEIMEQAISAS